MSREVAGLLGGLITSLLIFVPFYFLVTLPRLRKQRKLRQKAREQGLPWPPPPKDVFAGSLNISKLAKVLSLSGAGGLLWLFVVAFFSKMMITDWGVAENAAIEATFQCVWSSQIGSGLFSVPCPLGPLGPILLYVSLPLLIVGIITDTVARNSK